MFSVGDKVNAACTLLDPASGDSPGGVLCNRGDVLIVREVKMDERFPIKVSHEHITDNSFGVEPSEIEKIHIQ